MSETTTQKWTSRSWHRRASKPVTYWFIALIVAGIIHPILPEYRWVLIHLFTLGAITNSIVVWSQHFTEKFLHHRIPDEKRPWQLRKVWVLNAGAIITILGQLLTDVWDRHWVITSIGAGIVSGALVWHAFSLAGQFLAAKRGQPYAPAVVAYVASACCLPLGALAGGFLAAELPGTWQERVLLAHTVANILGFLGFAALGSLSVLYAAVWRTRLPFDVTRYSVGLMIIALPVILGGALSDNGYVAAGGLGLYAVAWVVPMGAWGRASISVLAEPRDRVGFSASAVGTAPLWLLGALVYLIAEAIAHHGELFQISLPTTAVLIGFGAQLLIGVMSHLLPSTIGGGPAAVRTGTYELGRAGLFRWTLLNGGLAIWLLTDNSWLRVVASLLSIGALVVFVPLMRSAVKAQRGVLMKKRDPVEPLTTPRYNQVTAGIAVLALVLAAFGGLGTTGGGEVAPVTDGDVHAVTIDAGNMVFAPDVIEVPAGKSLEVTLVNTDDMVHDLKFANGAQTGRVAPGEEVTITVGPITADMEGWCTIAGHRAQGMDLMVVAGS
ncbi:MAG: hypothetical protein GX983_06955 [Corynebacterium sp.]|nr:hypothetical protein [Corynebacterium sp.]